MLIRRAASAAPPDTLVGWRRRVNPCATCGSFEDSRDELDDHPRREPDEHLLFTGERDIGFGVIDGAFFQPPEQRMPFVRRAHAQRDVVDSRWRQSARRHGESRIRRDQVDDRRAVEIQPIAFETERRSRTDRHSRDIDKKAPYSLAIRRDYRGVIELHGVSLREMASMNGFCAMRTDLIMGGIAESASNPGGEYRAEPTGRCRPNLSSRQSVNATGAIIFSYATQKSQWIQLPGTLSTDEKPCPRTNRRDRRNYEQESLCKDIRLPDERVRLRQNGRRARRGEWHDPDGYPRRRGRHPLQHLLGPRESAGKSVLRPRPRARAERSESEPHHRRGRMRGEPGRRIDRRARTLRRPLVRAPDAASAAGHDRETPRERPRAGRHLVSGNRKIRPLAAGARRRPERVRLDHGRLQQVLQLLRRAVHAR